MGKNRLTLGLALVVASCGQPSGAMPTLDAMPTPDAALPVRDAGVDAATAIDAWVGRFGEEALLIDRQGAPMDELGAAVALDETGTRALVGAFVADLGKGKALVFVHDDQGWTEEATLTSGDLEPLDAFAQAVALSADGSVALLGAPNDDVAGVENVGSARVFVRTGATWTTQATLLAADRAAGDQLGWSVALSADGTRALVGVYADDTAAGADVGSARVFVRTGSSWTEEATLLASDGAPGDQLGWSVALSADGTRALIGANTADVGVDADVGSARVFVRSGTTWTEEAALTGAGAVAGDHLGESAALDGAGSRAVLGARWAVTGSGTPTGSARVYVRTGTTWSEESTLVASDGEMWDGLGMSVAIDGAGSVVLVGAITDSTSRGTGTGSARLFTRTGATWTETTTLLASDGMAGDNFGYAVALSTDGARAIVGANADTTVRGVGAGSARVIRLVP